MWYTLYFYLHCSAFVNYLVYDAVLILTFGYHFIH